MDYQEAASKLTGRCKESRKLCNNTYLKRRDVDAIAVLLHSTDVVTFFRDGSIEVNTGGWNTVTIKDRIRAYSPVRMWTESGHAFASFGEQTVALTSGHRAHVTAEGTLVGNSAEDERRQIKDEKNEAARPRNRARYWIRKARGLQIDREGCKAANRWGCHTMGRWNSQRLTEGQYRCGCVVSRRIPEYRGTVESIMREENVSVRVAKMQCYGIERFFLDAKATVIDEQAGYQLLELPLNRWSRMRALKMACTTTGAVYVNSVPPQTEDVASGLDWMFHTTDYLGTVSQQA